MNAITLVAPEPVTAVTVDKADRLVPIENTNALDERVFRYVNELTSMPASSPEFNSKMEQLSSFGQKEIRNATGSSNRFLDRPVRQIEGGVGQELVKLRQVVEKLDPSRHGDLLAPRKLLGFIPFGSKLKSYFDGYKSSQSHISEILRSLANGRNELLQDNIAIDSERRKIWEQIGSLDQMAYMAQVLDQRLEDKARDLDMVEPAKAKALRETALFYIRQRHQDILTQKAVIIQGYLALDLVKKNNIELIKGVDRASTTTIAALRTAVTVAQALSNQRLVLDQITAINSTTASIIENTGVMMKENSSAIHQQAASSTIPVETLQKAFQNIYATMDSIDSYKVKALESIKTTIESLSVETEKGANKITSRQE
jgi:uncharacterized protein YaaN involved in tellurite resistance